MTNADIHDSLSETLNIPRSSIREMLANSATTIRSLYLQLKTVAINLARANTESNTSELISKIIESPESINEKEIGRIMGSDDEILMMLLTYTTTKPEMLEELRKTNPTNWYVLYGIANNINASEDTLMKLMVPEDSNKSLEGLYTDFAWRNIYLYVAKNPSATSRVRQYIINYPNARDMDKMAAQRAE